MKDPTQDKNIGMREYISKRVVLMVLILCSADRSRVHVHPRLCHDLGARRMDIDRRDIPNKNKGQTRRLGHRKQLVIEALSRPKRQMV